MLDELSSDGDDSSGLILDELISDEEDSAGFVSLLLDSTGLSELDDLSSIFELEDSSVFTELDAPSVFAELEDKTFLELDEFSPSSLLLDSTLPELDEAFPSLEELPSTAFSLDEDPSNIADSGVCPELINGLSMTLDDELLPRATSSLEEERVASLSAGPAGESLEPSLPQALPSNAATTTIPPRTNFFIIKHLTPKYNPKPPRDQTPRHLKKNAVKMRFYEEFGTFLPKIQNRIEQKYKTKLDD
ncbi:MAG: hypothetical protein SPL19_05480 [Fibrobacter sp.]|nr:hypothetical protein [Fibrobacter sp.]MDY6370361.1 hypothetical protein [Fibrobacter sp.]MDY6389791.1 hypothetical protein [Fibrobacter sp.]